MNSTTEILQKIDDPPTDAVARARVLLAEERFAEAERMAGQAARALASSGEHRLLIEALQMRGVALARLGRSEEARAILSSATEVAESAGELEHAGRATLTIIEALGERLSNEQLCDAYERASEQLSSSSNLETLRRLTACARRVLILIQPSQPPPGWDNFSFRDAVLRYESGIIEKALKDAGGIVSRAAQMLGMKHHNNLVSILNSRHRELLGERKPIVPRRRSIIAYKKQHRPRDAQAAKAHETTKP